MSPACRGPSAVLGPGQSHGGTCRVRGGWPVGIALGKGQMGGSRAHGREGHSGQRAQSPEWAWQCEAASEPSPWKRGLAADGALKAT